MLFIKNRNVYYDTEAVSVPASGYKGKPIKKLHAKYRILICKALGCFIFFFTTSKQYLEKNYVEILNSDWEWKNPSHLKDQTRVELNDCSYLKDKDIWIKRKRGKIELVARVKQCLVERIREAYERGERIVPRKLRSGSLPINIAFQQQKTIEKILKNLGISS
jgi:hypothetical protein